MASALSRTCAAIRTLSGPKLTIRLSFSATDSIYLTRWLFNPMPEKALQMWGYGAITGKGGMGLGAVLVSAAFLVMGAIQSAAGADLPVDLELVLATGAGGRCFRVDQHRVRLSPTERLRPRADRPPRGRCDPGRIVRPHRAHICRVGRRQPSAHHRGLAGDRRCGKCQGFRPAAWRRPDR